MKLQDCASNLDVKNVRVSPTRIIPKGNYVVSKWGRYKKHPVYVGSRNYTPRANYKGFKKSMVLQTSYSMKEKPWELFKVILKGATTNSFVIYMRKLFPRIQSKQKHYHFL